MSEQGQFQPMVIEKQVVIVYAATKGPCFYVQLPPSPLPSGRLMHRYQQLLPGLQVLPAALAGNIILAMTDCSHASCLGKTGHRLSDKKEEEEEGRGRGEEEEPDESKVAVSLLATSCVDVFGLP